VVLWDSVTSLTLPLICAEDDSWLVFVFTHLTASNVNNYNDNRKLNCKHLIKDYYLFRKIAKNHSL